MKRLREEDIRRIFQEEWEREKRIEKCSDEAKIIQRRMRFDDFRTLSGQGATPETRLRDVSWTPFIQLVIDTYWKVVEEEVNEQA